MKNKPVLSLFCACTYCFYFLNRLCNLLLLNVFVSSACLVDWQKQHIVTNFMFIIKQWGKKQGSLVKLKINHKDDQ